MGISIGWAGAGPTFQTRRLRGRLTVEQALRRLLAGSGYAARRVNSTAWRVEKTMPVSRPEPARPPVPIRSPSPRPPLRQVTASQTGPEIVVTAQKRPEDAFTLSGAIAVARPDDDLPGRPLPSSRDMASLIDGIAVTNLGPGRNRQFIRGVADSPFTGSSQSTVAVVLDEVRATFDAPDPDLRLVDIERVEVLKGPQGPLYGSGALGGIYRIVTRSPDLDGFSARATIGGEAVGGGAPGGSTDMIVNLPLMRDRLGIRAVGYVAHEGGWIDNVDGASDTNRTRVRGARVALRLEPAPAWSVDLAGTAQDIDSRDSQYVDAPGDEPNRRARIAEPSDSDFRVVSLVGRGPVGPLKLTATTSLVRHGLSYRLDATPAAAQFGLTGPVRFDDRRRYEVRNHEVRLSDSDGSWLAGVSYMRARSENIATVTAGDRTVEAENRQREITEIAGFAEASASVLSRVRATLGGRLYATVTKDEATEREGLDTRQTRSLLVSPSAALSWSPTEHAFAYLRYARSTRPGGLAPGLADGTRGYEGDGLSTVDLGVRWHRPDGRIAATAGAYLTEWNDIQSDFLLPNGLVGTRNAGTGRIRGLESSVEWSPSAAVTLTSGVTYVDAHLVTSATGVEMDDLRLPVTPSVTARASLLHRTTWRNWTINSVAQVNYVGTARLSFDPGLDRSMGGYGVAAVGTTLSRDRLALSVRIDNLLGTSGDSFSFGNRFLLDATNQRTPLRPRTFSLSLTLAQ